MDPEIDLYYQHICTAVDRILDSMDGLSEEQINRQPIPGETSSLAVLAAHTMGNVEQGVLATVCGHPDHRNRDAEFETKAPSADELKDQWQKLKARIQAGLGAMSPADLSQQFQHPRRGPMTGWGVLLVVATHANEHAGHAEMTRQLVQR